MNGLFQSIRFDLAVFICALLLTCILALLPPLNLGGIWVWFYCVPLFLALRLLPAGWFVLLLVLANTIIFFAVAISLERWLAINGSTIALFVTLLVVRSRVGTEYGLLTVLLFHLLIDLPVAIISRQVVTNITFIEACFSAMGYSVGLLGSLIVSSIIMVVVSSRGRASVSNGKGTYVHWKNRESTTLPTSGEVIELMMASTLLLYLMIHLSVAGNQFLEGQRSKLRSDSSSDFRELLFDYRSDLRRDVARAVELNLTGLSVGAAAVNDRFDLGAFKQLLAPTASLEEYAVFDVAIVADGVEVIAKDASFSSADVAEALLLAEEFSNGADVYLLNLVRSDGSMSPAHVIRHKKIEVVVAYPSEKTLVDFQRSRVADLTRDMSQIRTTSIEFAEAAVPLEKLLPAGASYQLIDDGLLWDDFTKQDASSIQASAYESLPRGKFPHWLPYGRNTLVWLQPTSDVIAEVREFFLAPELYYWIDNYWDYFGEFAEEVSIDVLSTLLFFLVFIPLSRFIAEVIQSPLSDLTRILSNWREFRGGQFGTSTAFQMMKAREQSGIAEINHLEQGFRALAQEMMQDERRLTTIAANYDELLRSLPLGVLAVDYQSRVHFLNDALLEILGRKKEAIGLLTAHALVMLDKQIPVKEWQLVLESEQPKSLLLVVTHRLDQQGEDAGVWVIVTDLTLQKQTSAQLMQASKLATLGEMSTGMAHELNQPLNVIGLAVSNLRIISERGKMSLAAIGPKLDRIETAVRRAAVIIDHMRAYGRVAGDESVVLDIGDVIHGLCMLLRDQLALVEIQLVNRVDRYGIYVKGNAIQFEQVIINVINNARDAIRDSENPAGEIVIESLLQRGRVLVRISDTGPGIPTDALPHVFEPFFTTKPVGKGTGLGGSISYGIIREMHGDIWAENTAGGARITVSLPLVEDSLGDDASRESAGGAIK
jgi:signal transduction histidine kinase